MVIVGVVAFLWWSFRPQVEVVPGGAENEELSGASIEIKKNSIVIGGAPEVPRSNEVIYQNNIFSPATLNVAPGAKVTFVNRHVGPIRISSNPHPIHTSFREFDSDTLQPGESYQFIFGKTMTLEYHNHFNPGAMGKIVVK